MHNCNLTYHLLEKFEVATPGVKPSQLEVPGYPSEEIVEKLEMLSINGFTNVIAASDKLGRPYAGVIVELTRAGLELLEAARHNRRHAG